MNTVGSNKELSHITRGPGGGAWNDPALQTRNLIVPPGSCLPQCFVFTDKLLLAAQYTEKNFDVLQASGMGSWALV